MSVPAPERRHPHVLTLDDVATLTGKPPATVARWATAGTIPGVRFGRAWRFWAPAIAVTLHGPDGTDTVPALPARHVEPGMLTSHGLARVLDLPPANINRLVRAGAIPATQDLRWTISWPRVRTCIATGRPLAEPAPIA